MSLSTLPDIFKKGNTSPLRTRKQGGAFSLHLNSQSVEKYLPSRAGYAPGDQSYATLNGSKRRSISTASMHPKKSISGGEGFKKTDSARDKKLFNLP